MIRILHVVGGLNTGGSETLIMNIYRRIDRNIIQFDFIRHVESENFYDDEITSLGGKIYNCPRYKGSNHLAYKRWWKSFFLDHPDYRIIHAHSRSTAGIYLKIAQKAGLTTIAHSHSVSNGKGISALIKNTLQYSIRNYSDYMFACSNEAGKWLFGNRVLSSNFQVLPNAIDVTRFSYNQQIRDKYRKELNIENKFVIGHVGRMSAPKNHFYLLDVFCEINKIVEESVLVLLGDGELKTQIEDKAKELGVLNQVLFIGAVSNVNDYYQAMDVFVFPSIWEGFGMATIEAQASGLRCYISDLVPKSVNVCHDLVTFLSINSPASIWAQKICGDKKCEYIRESKSDFIIKAGYDINDISFKLQKFYEKCWIR